MDGSANLHPTFGRLLTRADKEQMNGQQSRVIWLCGLSGSGKTTLANKLERELFARGIRTHLLDGDNLRVGLNKGLSFSDADRTENIRRVAEVSKLLVQAGLVVINAFITPKKSHRELAREILGADLLEVYVRASFETCARRDVKGLYAKAAAGNIAQFTGQDSSFEEPETPALLLDTETSSLDDSLASLLEFTLQRVRSA